MDQDRIPGLAEMWYAQSGLMGWRGIDDRGRLVRENVYLPHFLSLLGEFQARQFGSYQQANLTSLPPQLFLITHSPSTFSYCLSTAPSSTCISLKVPVREIYIVVFFFFCFVLALMNKEGGRLQNNELRLSIVLFFLRGMYGNKGYC